MKGLFQCPPRARSFCPFRACGAKLQLYYLIVSFYPNFYLFFITFKMLLWATSGFIASSKDMLSGVT